MRRQLLALVSAHLLAASAAWGAADKDVFVEAIQASVEVPEDQLLDVGVRILSPGLPEDDPGAKEDKGVFEDLRKSESRFIACHLADTLQSTGHWGAVRVIPDGLRSVDVLITGEILASNGRELLVRLRAEDATGRKWFERKYQDIASSADYRDDAAAGGEPHQTLYNQFVNDLLVARGGIKPDQLREIHTVSRLRFAADLAPDPFAGYLEINRKGRVKIVHVPAEDDPMMVRVDQIRERDHMLVDALNEYYATFYSQMDRPYDEWRSFSYDEEMVMRKLRHEARMQKLIGLAAILGAAVAPGNSTAASAGRTTAAVVGSMVLSNGMSMSPEVKMHIEAIRELAGSFDQEMTPLLVEVDGQTLKLSGSAESQFEEWRELLRKLFAAETGVEVDANTGEPIAGTSGGF